jgi:repressor LexA
MPISPKQQRVFRFIRGVIQSTGQAPTISEIGRQFQMRSSASVHAVLGVLQHEGLIRIIPNIGRGIRLVESAADVVLPETSELVM